jgi:hypothetical protein
MGQLVGDVPSGLSPTPLQETTKFLMRPQVADGGDALQIWSVAENIFNKQ